MCWCCCKLMSNLIRKVKCHRRKRTNSSIELKLNCYKIKAITLNMSICEKLWSRLVLSVDGQLSMRPCDLWGEKEKWRELWSRILCCRTLSREGTMGAWLSRCPRFSFATLSPNFSQVTVWFPQRVIKSVFPSWQRSKPIFKNPGHQNIPLEEVCL